MPVTERKVSAIITAAGSGTRMGGISKPLIKICGKTAFERVLDAFSASLYIGEIVVACRDCPELENLAEQYSSRLPVKLVQGGNTRGKSVFNAVCVASKLAVAYAIHDCARPIIATATIDKVIEAAFKGGAATASTPVTDTVKYLTPDGPVKTPKRSLLRAVQTPQVFLRDVYLASAALAKKRGFEATDETTLAEKAGFKVTYVDTPATNIKLTTPQDITIAEALFEKDEV